MTFKIKGGIYGIPFTLTLIPEKGEPIELTNAEAHEAHMRLLKLPREKRAQEAAVIFQEKSVDTSRRPIQTQAPEG